MNQEQLDYLTALLNAKCQEETDYILYDVMPGHLTQVQVNEVLEVIGLRIQEPTTEDLLLKLAQVKEMLERRRENKEDISAFNKLEEELDKLLTATDK